MSIAEQDPDPPAEARRKPVAWFHARPAIILALVLFYPLGLRLLYRSPRPRRWEKLAGTILPVPLFLLEVLLLLSPYWDCGGGLHPSAFRIDFTQGWWQHRKVEQHRERQRAAQTDAFEPAEAMKNLSWPAFRGPNRDGIVPDSGISLDWVASAPRELWRQPVGEGYAAFTIGHGRAYTIEQRRDREVITCYDAATGRELWAYGYEASFKEVFGGDGPRATPTLYHDRIYALGAEGHLHCLDALTGKRKWGRNILSEFDADNLMWGMSGSPLIVDEKIVVTNSGKGGGSIFAFDSSSGELVWRTDAGMQGYASPMLVMLAGRRQILNLAGRSLNGIDPESGRVLWSYPWVTDFDINVSQPLLTGGDRVFISSGYGHGCALIEIEAVGGEFRVKEIWAHNKMKNKFTSSVLHDGFIYGLDERALACLDLRTGERRWKGGRYNYGSVLLVGNHLLVLGEHGELALVEADPEGFTEVGRIRILEGRTWNNHALVGGFLFARNHKEMVCYDLRGRVD